MKSRVFTALILTVFVCAALFGCGNSSASDESQSSVSGNNIPDNVVTLATSETDEAVTADSSVQTEVESSASDVSDTEPAETGAQKSEGSSSHNESRSYDDDDEVVIDEETLAGNMLPLLNSSKVHAKLTESVSYDAETVVAYEREYFIDGTDKVYINNSQKIIMTDDTVYVIDMDNMTFYSYARASYDSGLEFGYSADSYTLVSIETDDDGTVTETYTIALRGSELTSVWTFSPNGTFTVFDRNPDSGSFSHYAFEIVESDVSGMDLTVPDGLTETEPSEF